MTKRVTITKYAPDIDPDALTAAIGHPLPGWVTNSDKPGPGTLVAATVAHGGRSVDLTVDIPEPPMLPGIADTP
jgi:hypothetical protein